MLLYTNPPIYNVSNFCYLCYILYIKEFFFSMKYKKISIYKIYIYRVKPSIIVRIKQRAVRPHQAKPTCMFESRISDTSKTDRRDE